MAGWRSDLEAAARMAPVVLADWSRPQLCPTYLRSVAALLLGADGLLCVVPAACGGRERASA